MPRIRTVKPEFFRDEQLQDMERLHPELHPMLVFCGLWGHCDVNGVFPWAPRQLALDILPFLWGGSIGEAMGKCLELLWSFSYVSRFRADGKTWGWVPGFKRHQRISGKELQAVSKYPKPEDFEQEKHQGSNGEAPVKHPGVQEVEVEVEVEGKGVNPLPPPAEDGPAQPTKTNGFDVKGAFEVFWTAYPRRNGKRVGKEDAWDKYRAIVHNAETAAEVLKACTAYAENTGDGPGETSAKDAHRWLARGRWKEWLTPDVAKVEEPWDELEYV